MKDQASGRRCCGRTEVTAAGECLALELGLRVSSPLQLGTKGPQRWTLEALKLEAEA